jgi:hypothetical protein
VCEDLERNGSFEYSYEEEESTHVTLEVIDSDDDQHDVNGFNGDVRERRRSRDQPSAINSTNGNNSSDNDQTQRWERSNMADSEPDIETESDETSRDKTISERIGKASVSDAEEVASNTEYSVEYDDYVYSDVESESAKSVDSEAEYY